MCKQVESWVYDKSFSEIKSIGSHSERLYRIKNDGACSYINIPSDAEAKILSQEEFNALLKKIHKQE